MASVSFGMDIPKLGLKGNNERKLHPGLTGGRAVSTTLRLAAPLAEYVTTSLQVQYPMAARS